MSAIKGLLWNAGERRLRAAWRIALLPLVIAVIAFAPLALIAGRLEASYEAGLWLAGESRAMFDKTMDFIISPLFSVLIVFAVLLAARLIDRRDPRTLGLRIDRLWRAEFLFGLFIGAAMIAAVFAAEMALGWVRVAPRTEPSIEGVPIAMLWAFVVMKPVCIGTYEEIVSRGALLKNAAEGLRAVAPPRTAALLAAVVVAFIFSALHAATDNFSAASFMGLALNGMLFALPVLLTGRLAMSIGMHMTWNFTQGAVFGYPVSGDVENISLLASEATGPLAWTGGAYGPEAGLLAAVVMLAGAAAILAFIGARDRRLAIPDDIATYRPAKKPPLP